MAKKKNKGNTKLNSDKYIPKGEDETHDASDPQDDIFKLAVDLELR